VVPCFNEAARLDIKEFVQFVEDRKDIFLLLVDDGSTDTTKSLLQSLVGERMHVLALAVNGGKAEAVRQGILWCLNNLDSQYVGFWDADLATPFCELKRFESVLDDLPDVQIVTGARIKLVGRNITRKWYRHYLGRVFATCVSIAINLAVYDTQCGAKLFRKTALVKEIFDRPFAARWIFDVEILARLMTKRDPVSSIFELPLMRWEDIAGSRLKGRDFLVAIADLVRIFALSKLGRI
jgi:glycosyltransferase involved in cell wall biosynthesis